MNRLAPVVVIALVLPAQAPGAGGEDTPVGWASVEGGTTGGQGGATVTVSEASALVANAASKPPVIIRVSGTTRLSSPVRVASNKTILGMGSDASIVGGGFQVAKVS